MDKIFKLSHEKWTLDPCVTIIKKAELEQLHAANHILDVAKAEADKIKAEAESHYKERHDAGYNDGLEEGKEEYTFKIMETVLTSVDSLENLEKQLVEVVIAAVSKIIGELNEDQIVIRLIHKALNTIRGEKRILVKVPTNSLEAVRKELRPFLLSPDGSSGYIEVVGDISLKSCDCILETQMGVVEASLRSQLKILNASLRSRVNNE